MLFAFSAPEAEGFVETREGAGTFVSEYWPKPAPFDAHDVQGTDSAPGQGIPANDNASPDVICDFKLEAVDPELIPTAMWRRLMMRPMQSSGYYLSKVGDLGGVPELRRAVARFLGASRNTKTGPEHILIVSCIQQATSVPGQMFVTPGSPMIVERPGCSLIAPILGRAGAEIIPVLPDEDGLRVDLLPERRNALVTISPERQFPMGATLSTPRRKALPDWAERNDAHVLEVGFDSDFRYEGSPKPALRSLDHHGRFIYSAAFALTIGPGLRIGFPVLPHGLVDPALNALRLLDHAYPCQSQVASWLDQAVPCDFLEGGGYEKHLRRLRKIYMVRRDTLMRSFEQFFGPCDLSGTTPGAHLIWHLPDHLPGAQTCEALARSVSIKVNTMMTETVTWPEFLPGWDRRILPGYADLPEPLIKSAVERLAGFRKQTARSELSCAAHHAGRLR